MASKDNVASRLGLEQTENGYSLSGKSLIAGIGGPLGILEAVLPATSFSIIYAFTRSGTAAVITAASLSTLFILLRLLRRQSVQQALIGLLAIGLAAFLALRDGGQTADYFVPGFYTNAAYAAALLLSILLRRPIMGYVAQLLFGLENWRKSGSYSRLRLVTWIWFGFFAARLSVQLPLYFAGEVELLALSRVIMGAPAYAGLLALSWILLKRIAQDQGSKLESAKPKE